jgi:hypothetical protein
MAESLPALIYVSWGGSGRGTAFREAYDTAVEQMRGIVYLAILDGPTFGDLDDRLLDVVTQELTWLLEAQLRLVDREELATEVSTRTLVRGGDVADEVTSLVETLGTDLVLLGAPLPTADDRSVEQLLEELTERTGVDVRIIGNTEP